MKNSSYKKKKKNICNFDGCKTVMESVANLLCMKYILNYLLLPIGLIDGATIKNFLCWLTSH